MSVGHRHSGKIDQDRDAELHQLMADPQFAAAVANYKNEDDTRQIPYGGGSDTEGTTVFWDKAASDRIKAGLFRIAGQPRDPRPTGKVHEAVEGAAIRHLGKDYFAAHDLADTAERHAVAAKGWDWNEYQDAWKPLIKQDEHETITNPPPNLLLTPYRGTKLFAKLAAFQKTPSASMASSAAPTAGPASATAAPSQPKLPQAAVQYGPGHPPEFCLVCANFLAPASCTKVVDPINPRGWCKLWTSKGQALASPQ